MFQFLASQIGDDDVLTRMRPSVIATFLERVWNSQAAIFRLGAARNTHVAHGREGQFDPLAEDVDLGPIEVPDIWHHLVYAYMYEATGLAEVMRRLVVEYTHGERLPLPTQVVQWWARATEELFFMTPNPYWVFNVTSEIRPDAGAVRRNAYYRLLGWHLPAPGGRRAEFVQPEAANLEFGVVLEALLKEVWRAYANRNNFVAEDQTDRGAIGLLVEKLQNMLNSRRFGGLLSREEFFSVAMMDWFALTIAGNNAVILSLGVPAESPAERLRKIGDMVRVPVHSRADAFIRMAEPLSVILRAIEMGAIDPNAPDSLWNPGLFGQQMLTVMTNWPLATGRALRPSQEAAPALSASTQSTRAISPVPSGAMPLG